MKKAKKKTVYYENELEDEFSSARIAPRRIDEKYIYMKDTPLWRVAHFFWYRIIFAPIAFFYTKLKFRHRIVGAERLRECSEGYFIYGNHTQDIGDAFMPNMMDFRRDKYFIVHPNNVSMPLLGRITPYLGALPLPDTVAAHKNFTAAIEARLCSGCGIVIYPEAHIWPYYTGIRPFSDVSFSYPVKYGSPVFCFTNTYKSIGRSKRPQIITYVDGPFYPKGELSAREARAELRERVYECMKMRSISSDMTVITYLKKESKND